MKRTCQFCQSPLFETDTVCWHCGRQQTSSSQATQPAIPPNTETVPEGDPEQELEPVGSRLFLYYAGLMLFIIFALLLVTSSLGQSPILAFKLDESESDWVALTSPDKSFSIEIPATWDWHFQEGARLSTSFEEILQNDERVKLAVLPLADFVPDTEYLFIAQRDQGLMVVARSERLNRLPPQQAVTAIQAEYFENISVTGAKEIAGSTGEPRAQFSVTHAGLPLQCDQHMVPSPTYTFLVAACAAPDDYDWQQEIFRDGLSSFTGRVR